jgi:hypothetical protein
MGKKETKASKNSWILKNPIWIFSKKEDKNSNNNNSKSLIKANWSRRCKCKKLLIMYIALKSNKNKIKNPKFRKIQVNMKWRTKQIFLILNHNIHTKRKRIINIRSILHKRQIKNKIMECFWRWSNQNQWWQRILQKIMRFR